MQAQYPRLFACAVMRVVCVCGCGMRIFPPPPHPLPPPSPPPQPFLDILVEAPPGIATSFSCLSPLFLFPFPQLLLLFLPPLLSSCFFLLFVASSSGFRSQSSFSFLALPTFRSILVYSSPDPLSGVRTYALKDFNIRSYMSLAFFSAYTH